MYKSSFPPEMLKRFKSSIPDPEEVTKIRANKLIIILSCEAHDQIYFVKHSSKNFKHVFFSLVSVIRLNQLLFSAAGGSMGTGYIFQPLFSEKNVQLPINQQPLKLEYTKLGIL